jgi:hypothetical protein
MSRRARRRPGSSPGGCRSRGHGGARADELGGVRRGPLRSVGGNVDCRFSAEAAWAGQRVRDVGRAGGEPAHWSEPGALGPSQRCMPPARRRRRTSEAPPSSPGRVPRDRGRPRGRRHRTPTDPSLRPTQGRTMRGGSPATTPATTPHQQHLIAIASKEVLAHADIVLNPPDGTPLCDSHDDEHSSGRLLGTLLLSTEASVLSDDLLGPAPTSCERRGRPFGWPPLSTKSESQLRHQADVKATRIDALARVREGRYGLLPQPPSRAQQQLRPVPRRRARPRACPGRPRRCSIAWWPRQSAARTPAYHAARSLGAAHTAARWAWRS